MWTRGHEVWDREGIAVSQVGRFPVTHYTGEKLEDNSAALGALGSEHLPAVWASSTFDYADSAREFDQGLKVTNAAMDKGPLNLDQWAMIAAERYPHGLPEPNSDDPTLWISHGDPCWSAGCDQDPKGTGSGSTRFGSTGLQIAIARLLGYRLPTEFDMRLFIRRVRDRRKDGFHVLMKYHRLAGLGGEGRRTLESLTYPYLNDWIHPQRASKGDGTTGADARFEHTLDLGQQHERILEGEPRCDHFVRWKPLHTQSIGWVPDRHGVRLNIRAFMSVAQRKAGRPCAGILRWKPNVKWDKDRGKEPNEFRPSDESPWFWGCPGVGSTDGLQGVKGRKIRSESLERRPLHAFCEALASRADGDRVTGPSAGASRDSRNLVERENSPVGRGAKRFSKRHRLRLGNAFSPMLRRGRTRCRSVGILAQSFPRELIQDPNV